MEKNFRLSKLYLKTVSLFILLGFAVSSVNAQVSCPDEISLWSENFGSGTTPTSNPDVISTALIYQETGSLGDEGVYRVSNTTQGKPEWHASGDHTGNVNGRALVVNGQAEVFYQHEISSTGFVPGNYIVSFYIMNVNPTGLCAPDPLLPVMTFTVEYLSSSNLWVPMAGSPYTAAAIPQSATPVWVNVGSSFTLPSTGNYMPGKIRIILGDGTGGGCGNDFALDDIKFSLCPEGGPAPVEFMNFKGQQKGNSIILDWSTAQEINNSYFEIQRSPDGNSDWNKIATIPGAGNSQVLRDYNTVDASPLSGNNYYRIKQVDQDGRFKYSSTVVVKTNTAKIGVSVLVNPFRNNLSVNFVSAASQVVSARLIDITGKQVAGEKWSVAPGTTKQTFSSTSGLQQGLYILSIRNESGEILYNGKVIKQ